jgi:hypothetical protein
MRQANSTSAPSNGSSISGGAIAGIVVGVIVVLGIIIVATLFFSLRGRNRRRASGRLQQPVMQSLPPENSQQPAMTSANPISPLQSTVASPVSAQPGLNGYSSNSNPSWSGPGPSPSHAAVPGAITHELDASNNINQQNPGVSVHELDSQQHPTTQPATDTSTAQELPTGDTA